MVGRTISHYKILSELGRGGMGVVYKAEDTKLERPVALKFLAAHAIEDPEHKARFVREAKAAARLDHQNICPIYAEARAESRFGIAIAASSSSMSLVIVSSVRSGPPDVSTGVPASAAPQARLERHHDLRRSDSAGSDATLPARSSRTCERAGFSDHQDA